MTISHKLTKATPDEICLRCVQCFAFECRAYQQAHNHAELTQRLAGECLCTLDYRDQAEIYGNTLVGHKITKVTLLSGHGEVNTEEYVARAWAINLDDGRMMFAFSDHTATDIGALAVTNKEGSFMRETEEGQAAGFMFMPMP